MIPFCICVVTVQFGSLQVKKLEPLAVGVIPTPLFSTYSGKRSLSFRNEGSRAEFSLSFCTTCSARSCLFPITSGWLPKWKKNNSTLKRMTHHSLSFTQHASLVFVRVAVGVMLVMSVSLAFTNSSGEFHLFPYSLCWSFYMLTFVMFDILNDDVSFL